MDLLNMSVNHMCAMVSLSNERNIFKKNNKQILLNLLFTIDKTPPPASKVGGENLTVR